MEAALFLTEFLFPDSPPAGRLEEVTQKKEKLRHRAREDVLRLGKNV